MFGVAPIADVPKNVTIRQAQLAAFGDPRFEPFRLPVPPITVGALTKMVVLRKAIADGTARPEQIAEFEATSKERQETLDKAYVISAESLVAARADKLFISGMWNALYHVAKLVREMGYSAKDFHPDNCIYVGGGLKRAQLPPDYQEFVYADLQHPGQPQVSELQHAGAQLRHAALPEGRPLPRAAVDGSLRPRQGG